MPHPPIRLLCRKLIITVLFAAVGISSFLAPERCFAATVAEAGTLDLRAWDFDRNGVVPLNGEWGFVWKRFVRPSMKAAFREDIQERFVQVPAPWNAHVPGGAASNGSGFATYRLRIVLSDPFRPYSVYIPEVATACALFVDGVRRLDVGRPGTDATRAVPMYASSVVTFLPRGPDVDLVLWVSNFHHRLGGLWEEIFFGPADKVHAYRLQRTGMDLFLFGAILIIGLYHLIVYGMRREELYPLFFALFCFIMAVRVLVTGERFLNVLLPSIPWGATIRIEYLSFYLGGCVLVLFLHSLFPEEFRRVPLTAILVLASPLVFSVIAFPSTLFTRVLPAAQILTLASMVYALAALVLAVRRGRTGSGVFLAGLLLFFAATVHDILYAHGLIESVYLFHVGVFAMMLSLACVIARRYGWVFRLIHLQREKLNAANLALQRELADRKAAEERLARYSADLEAEVEERTRSLKEAQDTMIRREKLATLGQLAGGVGHELRNPLGAIRNATYFLNMALEKPCHEVREALAILERETMRSERTIASLFSHADPGKPAIVPGVDLHAILQRTLTDTETPASVAIDDRLDASLPPIDGDPHQLEQVFGNLFRNAVQAMREGGTLAVRSTVLEDGRVEVAVSDTGEGIPEDQRKMIFEPLFTTKAKGIGLGLALCKSHVEAHGGTIEVESEKGRETTFRVILPVRDA